MGSGTGILNRASLAFCLLLFWAGGAFASPPSLRVRQAYLDIPSLTVYADLLDSSGKLVVPKEAGQLKATLAGQPYDIFQWGAFSAQDDGLLMIFLVDVSSSIGESRFGELQETISSWIRRMRPPDRAAVVAFGEDVTVPQGITAEQNALLYSVQSLAAEDSTAQLNLGILRALEIAKVKDPGIPRRRMILLCSDGFKETPGGATSEEVRNALASDPVPIYSVFFDSPMRESTNRTEEAQQLLNELGYGAGAVDGKLGPRTVLAIRTFQQSRGVAWDGTLSDELLGVLRTLARNQKEGALTSIGEYSRRSGGQLYRAGTSPFPTIFDSIAASIDNSLWMSINLEGLLPDGSVKRVEISYFDGTLSLSDGIGIRLTGTVPAEEKKEIPPETTEVTPVEKTSSGLPAWFYFLAVPLVAGPPVALFLARKRRMRAAAPGSPASPDSFEAREAGPTIVIPAGEERPAGAPSPTTPLRLPASMKIELVVAGGKDGAVPYKATVTDRMIIGRSEGPSSITIPGDATISARHCELVYSKGRLFVNDLQSSNGTMVNGVPIQGNYPMEDGDRLTLGKTEMRIRILEVK